VRAPARERKVREMANYKITLTVDAARIETVRKKAVEVFGENAGAQISKCAVATSRDDRLGEAESSVGDALSIVEELKDEMEQWRDSIPENLQSGEKHSQVEEAISALEEIQSNLEGIEFGSVDFPGMF
jgi:hypothetical protein